MPRHDDQRPLGRSEVKVTALGFGGNVPGNLYAPLDDAVARDAVTAAFESGSDLKAEGLLRADAP